MHGKKSLAGGPVARRIAIRFISEAESASQVDRVVTSLPLWPPAKTRITPLISFVDHQQHAHHLLENIAPL